MTVNNDGSYKPFADTSNADFPPGSALTVSAAGQTGSEGVPMFQSMITPPGGNFTMTNPDGSRLNPVFTLNQKQDFQLTWTALAPASRVHAELSQNTDSNQGLYLECDYDGSTGQGVMPATLLGSFQLSNGQFYLGSLLIGPSMSQTVQPSGWDISIFAIGDGSSAIANITDS